MNSNDFQVVTGAFGYSGSYITSELLKKGIVVRTLTNSPMRKHPLRDKIEALPFSFEDRKQLTESLKGCTVLYNTYWVRFNHRNFVHSEAVKNTEILFDCAKIAGVKKIVHISITNPDINSDLEYFSGKAYLEDKLIKSGMEYAILRPTVLFGLEDILINNIAWVLRKMPVFGIFGDGKYKIQPIFVGDLADLAIRKGEEKGNSIIDAIGPETYTFRELVELMNQELKTKKWIVGIQPFLAYLVARVINLFTKDELVTWPEIKGLMRNLLFTDSVPTGTTRISEWLKVNRDSLGIKYANEVRRREDRKESYK